MVYRHRPERKESGIAPIVTYLRGSELAFRERRVVQAKIIDHSHSGYIYDLYDDLNQAGIKLLEDAPSYAVEIGRCFGSEGKQHFDHYKEKYRSLAQLQDYQPERGWIRKEEDGLAFHVSMGSHCVLYLVLE
jgi:hypothetical protein